MDDPETLGGAIRRRRYAHKPKLSQEALGRLAGYATGAGVAISRIESSQMSPSPTKLEGIARALGTTPEVLREEARRMAADHLVGRTEPDGTDDQVGKRTLKDRVRAAEEKLQQRTETVTLLADQFNVAHDGARDEFFLPFVEEAKQIKNAPTPPEPRGLTDEERADAAAGAEYRVRFSSTVVAKAVRAAADGAVGAAAGGAAGAAGAAAGGAAAYATFTAAAMFGTASTGAAITGLAGVAATDATLAFLGGGALAAGGAGVAGGTMLLAGIVAAPAVLLAAGGFLWLAHRRSKRVEAQLRERLDEVEAKLAAEQIGFDALVDALRGATGVLGYIRVHATHALDRWSEKLATHPLNWSDMSEAEQERYNDFLEVAGCQLTTASLNLGALMSLRDESLNVLIETVFEDLAQAKKTVEALV